MTGLRLVLRRQVSFLKRRFVTCWDPSCVPFTPSPGVPGGYTWWGVGVYQMPGPVLGLPSLQNHEPNKPPLFKC
jgi:hypothetical protein